MRCSQQVASFRRTIIKGAFTSITITPVALVEDRVVNA